MTHPTLGYNNFRFGDDLVHMPATPTATLTVACSAGSGPLSGDDPLPHQVDAAVTCPECEQAYLADWWMAELENERRTGDTTSLVGTLDDVTGLVDRLMSQADAVVDETMLGGGASMVPALDRGYSPIDVRLFHGMFGPGGFGSATPSLPPLPLAGPAVQVSASSDYHFGEDKVELRARSGDAKAYATIEYPIDQEKLDDAVEQLARGLVGSPLAALRRATLQVAKEGSWTGDAPLVDPGADRMRRAIEAAQQKLDGLPMGDENVPRGYPSVAPKEHDCAAESCGGMSADYGPCGGCCSCLRSGCVYDEPYPGDMDEIEFTHGGEVDEKREEFDYPDVVVPPGRRRLGLAAEEQAEGLDGPEEPPDDYIDSDMDEIEFTEAIPTPPGNNWCHVHNREALPRLEICVQCCDHCNYDTHRCRGCGEPLTHGMEICEACSS